jgi:30S ribosomal protein S31
MGKGDIKSRRGKLFSGSFGVRRPKKNKVATPVTTSKATVKIEEKSVKTTSPEAKKPVQKKAAPKPKKEPVSEQDTAASE